MATAMFGPVWWMALAAAVAGCAPPITAGGDEGEVHLPPEPVMEPFDYRTCERGAVVAPCETDACAEPGTEALLRQFRDALATFEFADYVEISGAGLDVNRYRHTVDYQVHVGWVRAAMEVAVHPEASAAERADAIAEAIEAIELPTSLAPPAVVRDALVDCLPQVPFDPCTAFETVGVAAAQTTVNQGGLITWKARVDTETGIVLVCGPD